MVLPNMNDTPDDSAAKKIIIDEDWKARVEAEREALRKKQGATPTGGPTEKPASEAQRHPPPASLATLIASLAFQATMSLGLVADPQSAPPQPHLDEARHLIDMLQVLEEKTAGNRTPEESRLLENTLHDLRMAYVAVQSRPIPPAPKERS
jgi:hypothetical protein